MISSRTYTTVCTCLHTTHRLTSVMCKHISCAATRVLRQWGSGISVAPTGKTLSRCAFDALPQVQNEAPVQAECRWECRQNADVSTRCNMLIINTKTSISAECRQFCGKNF